MNWNHRVWKNTDKNGEIFFGIFETYYNNVGDVCGRTENFANVCGENTQELKETVIRLHTAFEKPLLNGDGFVYAKWDGEAEEAIAAVFDEAKDAFVLVGASPTEKPFNGLEEAFDDVNQGFDELAVSVPVPPAKPVKGKK